MALRITRDSLQKSLLVDSGDQMLCQGIKPRLIVCKADALPAVLPRSLNCLFLTYETNGGNNPNKDKE